MIELKHTPGPWVIDPIFINVKDGGSCPAYIRDQNNTIIVDMNFNIPAGIGSKECTANAKLISAAPDMLEALRLALPYIEGAYECAFPDSDHNESVLNMVREAIDKATK